MTKKVCTGFTKGLFSPLLYLFNNTDFLICVAFRDSEQSDDDDQVVVVSETHQCQHCVATFSSKSALDRHVTAVNLANVLKPKSIGLKDTGASYIPDTWVKPVYPSVRKCSPSPVTAVPKKKKKVSKQITAKHEPQDWHVLDDVIDKSDSSDSDVSDKEVKSFKKWKVFKGSKARFFKNSVAITKTLLNPDTEIVNKTVPAGCDDNISFVVDKNETDISDITSDGTGKYRRPSYSRSDIEIGDEKYTLVRKYYAHKDTPGFKRTIYVLEKCQEPLQYVIIRYEWVGQKSSLIIKPHGNAKNPDSAQPYLKTKNSVLKKLKEASSQERKPANKMINDLYQVQGGSEGISSFSDVPRDAKQVYRHGPPKQQVSDFSLLLRANLMDEFVHSVEFVQGNPRVFLCSPEQAADVLHFCCKGNAVLNVDPTYELGPFLVTPTSYRHPMFVN